MIFGEFLDRDQDNRSFDNTLVWIFEDKLWWEIERGDIHGII